MHPLKEEKNSWVFFTLVWGPSVQWWDPLAAGECDVGPLLCPPLPWLWLWLGLCVSFQTPY